jgi:hypothetical protein
MWSPATASRPLRRSPSCAWAATWFVPQSKILDAIKLVGKLNDAIRTGLGIDDALKAVEAIGLDAKAMAELKA